MCIRDSSNATRGLFAGGGSGPKTEIQFITIATLGNAVLFGNLTVARQCEDGVSSPVRCAFGGGYEPGNSSVIDYVAFATEGDAIDFGDLTTARHAPSGVSNAHGGLG